MSAVTHPACIHRLHPSPAEPFDRSNTARSCCDDHKFERVKNVFMQSWRKLRETHDLSSLFGSQLVAPAQFTFYDNYVHSSQLQVQLDEYAPVRTY